MTRGMSTISFYEASVTAMGRHAFGPANPVLSHSR
jgi:hypothetical protein